MAGLVSSSPPRVSSGTATAVPATTAPVAMRARRPLRVSRIVLLVLLVLRGGVFVCMRAR
ncbi:hypothetical protein GCM10027074_18110 [Streptomyces deserti]